MNNSFIAHLFWAILLFTSCHPAGTSKIEVAQESTSPTGGGGSVSGSQTFSYSGLDESFTVPATVTSLTVKCWGAGGGGATDWGGTGAAGGAGAFVQSTIAVTPGESLNIVVGKGGISGVIPPVDNGYMGGTGGGYTGIFRGVPAQANALLVAAGGGGGSSNGNTGGAGGITNGENGSGAYSGFGATLVAAGANGGSVCCWLPGDGNELAGGSALGSAGDAGYSNGGIGGPGSSYGAGGGGGAGYYGGGGGGYGGGAGAGGSSFVTGTASVLLPGAGTTPGNAADTDRAGAGVGGGNATNGTNGIMIISW